MARLSRGSPGSFVLRRMGSSRLLLGSIVVAVLVSSGIAAALVTFFVRTLPADAQQELKRSDSTSIDVSAQVTLPEATTDGRVIGASIRSALGAIPVTLDDALWSDPFRLPGQLELGARHPGIQVQAQAAALDGITANAVLTAGAWPPESHRGRPIPAALPFRTARVLRLKPGDLLTVHDNYTGALVRLRITGTFRPRNPASQYWPLSLLGTSGSSLANGSLTYGPLIIGRAAFESGRLAVIQASWVAIAQAARIPVADYAGLASRIRNAQAGLAHPGANSRLIGGLTVTTAMPRSLDASASSFVVARSLLLIGALQLLLIAAAAIALSAQRLAAQREEESALLCARGMARRQLALRAGAEAVALAALPAAAGAVAGSRLVSSAPHSAGLATAIPGSVWLTAGAIFAGSAAIMLWPVLSPGEPGSASVRRGRQISLAGTVRAGADLALVALGAIALWQLRLFSAAPRGASGNLGVYPVLAVAPTLALAGATMILLRSLPALARVMDNVTARTTRLTASLASWQVSRRPVRQSGPALLVVLAVATGTLALAEHQSWLQSAADQADFAAGADVRVDLPAPLPLGRGATLTHADGVATAMPVARFGYNNGGEVLALNARQAAATVLLRPDLAVQPAAGLWRAITPAGPRRGLELPGRPARLLITARLGPPALARSVGAISVSVSVQDADGIVYSVPAGLLTAGQHQLVARLSAIQEGSYPFRLLAVTLTYTLPRHPVSGQTVLTIGGLADSASAAGQFPAPFASGNSLGRWRPGISAPVLLNSLAALPKGTARLPSLARAPESSRSSTTLAFIPGYGAIPAPAPMGPTPVTAVLTLTTPIGSSSVSAIATDAFLSANQIHVGDLVSMMVGTDQVTAGIVAAVREFPTISDGLGGGRIMDQAAIQDQLVSDSAPPLPVTEWWLRTTTGGVRSRLPAGAVSTDRARVAAALLSDPLNRAQQLALLASALAAGLLAALGFSVSVVGSVRERRTQSALLAALGVNRAAQARQLCLEQLILSGPAAAVGLLLGAGLARLLVPVVTLTGSGQPPVPAVLIRTPLGWALGLALCVTVVPVLAAAATVVLRPDPAAQLRAAAAT